MIVVMGGVYVRFISALYNPPLYLRYSTTMPNRFQRLLTANAADRWSKIILTLVQLKKLT
jgi:hypothetical protein